MLNTGFKIAHYREQKGWTQAELAAKAGMAQANLSNIEKGKRDLNVSTLVRLGRALEVRAAELIDEEESVSSTFPLKRSQIETLAEAVLDPKLKVSREVSDLAHLFREILPTNGARTSTRKIQKAWDQLRKRFSLKAIEGICRRIEDVRQREYAKKTN